jgi:tetratricopeptide (TPR) repeat protein
MFERAATLDPAFAPAYAELAVADLLLYNNYVDRTEARLAEARAALGRALRLNPNLPEARYALGEYYSWNLHDWVHALEEFQRIRRFRPNYTRVFDPLADVARRQGKWKESLAAYRMALELNPRSATVLASMGDVYIALRRYPEAIAVYDRALEIAPHSVDLRFTKALAYLSQTGDLPRVRRLLPEVSENMAPTGVEVLVATLADVVSLLDDAQQAKLLQLMPAALDGDTAGLALAKAMVYRMRGQEVAAHTYFDSARTALEVNLATREDAYGRFHCMLGIALAGLGRSAEAIREGNRAVEALPLSKDALEGPLMIANLARIYVMLGDSDAAVRQLELVLTHPGPLSSAWLRADPFFASLRSHPGFRKLVAPS